MRPKGDTKAYRRVRLDPFPDKIPKKTSEKAQLMEREAHKVLARPAYLRFATAEELQILKHLTSAGSATYFVDQIGEVKKIFDNIHERHRRWYDLEEHHPDNLPSDARAAFNFFFKDDKNLAAAPVTLEDFKNHFDPKKVKKGEVRVKGYGKGTFLILKDGEVSKEARSRLISHVKRKAKPKNRINTYHQMTHVDHFLADGRWDNAFTALGKAYKYYIKHHKQLHDVEKSLKRTQAENNMVPIRPFLSPTDKSTRNV